ncbi:hypothetical protein [Akkermansia sp.]
MRGLKLWAPKGEHTIKCRTLTGAWIETGMDISEEDIDESHPHGCVD